MATPLLPFPASPVPSSPISILMRHTTTADSTVSSRLLSSINRAKNRHERQLSRNEDEQRLVKLGLVPKLKVVETDSNDGRSYTPSLPDSISWQPRPRSPTAQPSGMVAAIDDDDHHHNQEDQNEQEVLEKDANHQEQSAIQTKVFIQEIPPFRQRTSPSPAPTPQPIPPQPTTASPSTTTTPASHVQIPPGMLSRLKLKMASNTSSHSAFSPASPTTIKTTGSGQPSPSPVENAPSPQVSSTPAFSPNTTTNQPSSESSGPPPIPLPTSPTLSTSSLASLSSLHSHARPIPAMPDLASITSDFPPRASAVIPRRAREFPTYSATTNAPDSSEGSSVSGSSLSSLNNSKKKEIPSTGGSWSPTSSPHSRHTPLGSPFSSHSHSRSHSQSEVEPLHPTVFSPSKTPTSPERDNEKPRLTPEERRRRRKLLEDEIDRSGSGSALDVQLSPEHDERELEVVALERFEFEKEGKEKRRSRDEEGRLREERYDHAGEEFEMRMTELSPVTERTERSTISSYAPSHSLIRNVPHRSSHTRSTSLDLYPSNAQYSPSLSRTPLALGRQGSDGNFRTVGSSSTELKRSSIASSIWSTTSPISAGPGGSRIPSPSKEITSTRRESEEKEKEKEKERRRSPSPTRRMSPEVERKARLFDPALGDVPASPLQVFGGASGSPGKRTDGKSREDSKSAKELLREWEEKYGLKSQARIEQEEEEGKDLPKYRRQTFSPTLLGLGLQLDIDAGLGEGSKTESGPALAGGAGMDVDDEEERVSIAPTRESSVLGVAGAGDRVSVLRSPGGTGGRALWEGYLLCPPLTSDSLRESLLRQPDWSSRYVVLTSHSLEFRPTDSNGQTEAITALWIKDCEGVTTKLGDTVDGIGSGSVTGWVKFNPFFVEMKGGGRELFATASRRERVGCVAAIDEAIQTMKETASFVQSPYVSATGHPISQVRKSVFDSYRDSNLQRSPTKTTLASLSTKPPTPPPKPTSSSPPKKSSALPQQSSSPSATSANMASDLFGRQLGRKSSGLGADDETPSSAAKEKSASEPFSPSVVGIAKTRKPVAGGGTTVTTTALTGSDGPVSSLFGGGEKSGTGREKLERYHAQSSYSEFPTQDPSSPVKTSHPIPDFDYSTLRTKRSSRSQVPPAIALDLSLVLKTIMDRSEEMVSKACAMERHRKELQGQLDRISNKLKRHKEGDGRDSDSEDPMNPTVAGKVDYLLELVNHLGVQQKKVLANTNSPYMPEAEKLYQIQTGVEELLEDHRDAVVGGVYEYSRLGGDIGMDGEDKSTVVDNDAPSIDTKAGIHDREEERQWKKEMRIMQLKAAEDRATAEAALSGSTSEVGSPNRILRERQASARKLEGLASPPLSLPSDLSDRQLPHLPRQRPYTDPTPALASPKLPPIPPASPSRVPLPGIIRPNPIRPRERAADPFARMAADNGPASTKDQKQSPRRGRPGTEPGSRWSEDTMPDGALRDSRSDEPVRRAQEQLSTIPESTSTERGLRQQMPRSVVSGKTNSSGKRKLDAESLGGSNLAALQPLLEHIGQIEEDVSRQVAWGEQTAQHQRSVGMFITEITKYMTEEKERREQQWSTLLNVVTQLESGFKALPGAMLDELRTVEYKAQAERFVQPTTDHDAIQTDDEDTGAAQIPPPIDLGDGRMPANPRGFGWGSQKKRAAAHLGLGPAPTQDHDPPTDAVAAAVLEPYVELARKASQKSGFGGQNEKTATKPTRGPRMPKTIAGQRIWGAPTPVADRKVRWGGGAAAAAKEADEKAAKEAIDAEAAAEEAKKDPPIVAAFKQDEGLARALESLAAAGDAADPGIIAQGVFEILRHMQELQKQQAEKEAKEKEEKQKKSGLSDQEKAELQAKMMEIKRLEEMQTMAAEQQTRLDGLVQQLTQKGEVHEALLKEIAAGVTSPKPMQMDPAITEETTKLIGAIQTEVEKHVKDFRGQLTGEVQRMFKEVGKLRDEKKDLQAQIADLLAFQAKQAGAGSGAPASSAVKPSPKPIQAKSPAVPASKATGSPAFGFFGPRPLK